MVNLALGPHTDAERFAFQGNGAEVVPLSSLPHQDLFTAFLCGAEPPSHRQPNQVPLWESSGSQIAPRGIGG